MDSLAASATPSPIQVHQLQKELDKHPDSQFVTTLISGFTFGFDTGISRPPVSSLVCKNNLSARVKPNIVTKLMTEEAAKGFLIGPFTQPPFPIYRINPLGLAQGKYSNKYRLIVDMSAPHNTDVPSLNELISKEDYSMAYVRVDDAVNIIQRMGIGTQLCKFDIRDAFKQVPIHPSLWHLHGVKWTDQYYFYTRLVFGSRSSPKLFDYLSQAVCWIATENYNVSCVLHLLDDFLCIDPPGYMADRTMAIMAMIFHRLGVPLATHKTVGPTTKLEYLGIELDTIEMQARLPSAKIIRIKEVISLCRNKSSITKRQLLSLLGHLNFAARVIPPGRAFVSFLISLSTTVDGLFKCVTLDKNTLMELAMWDLFLTTWNGISMFRHTELTLDHDFHLYTDAASTLGFGGLWENQWFAGEWPAEIASLPTTSLALMELYPIVVAVYLWGHSWSRRRICFHCDNSSTVHILRKGRSPKLEIMKLMRTITLLEMKYNFSLTARHLPGKLNHKADALSRLQFQTFRELAPSAELHPLACPSYQQLTGI